MRLYNLERLAKAYRLGSPSMSWDTTRKRARELRRELNRMDRNERNNDQGFYAHHILVGLGQEDPESIEDRAGSPNLSTLATRLAFPCESPSMQDPADAWCGRLDLQEAMRRLPRKLRRVLRMSAERYTKREMAIKLGISLSTAHRLREKAHRRLRCAWEVGHV